MRSLRFLFLLALLDCATRPPHLPEALTSIPIQVLDGRLILVAVSVNGSRPLSFILDTGAASGTFLNASRLSELGLHAEQVAAEQNPGGEVQIGHLPDVTLQVGGIRLAHQAIVTAPLSGLEPFVGQPIDGILGHAFLQWFILRIHYDTARIDLLPADAAVAGGITLPLQVTDNMPFIEATLENHGQATPARLEIDTGSFEALGLNGGFVSRNNLVGADQKRFEERGIAIGGATKGYRTRIAALRLGTAVLTQPVINVTIDAGGYEPRTNAAGVLGAEVLRRFDVTIDYPHQRVILQPNKHFGDAYVQDMSGMRIVAAPPDFRAKTIAEVMAGSPASDAGLQEGDVLVSVDGVPSRDEPLVSVVQRFRTSGAVRRLVVQRGATTTEFLLRLRPLV